MRRLAVGFNSAAIAFALTLAAAGQAAAQFGLACPGTWVNSGGGMMCLCPDGTYANMVGGSVVCPQRAPPPALCNSGFYPSSGRCIRLGHHLCFHEQFACRDGTRCTATGCIPNDIPEYAVCTDQKSWCNSGNRCVWRGSANACISNDQWLRERAQESVRVREARRSLLEYQSQLTREERLKIDRHNARLLMTEHAVALVDKGVGVFSGLALASYGFKEGGAYYAGVRGLSDIALGQRTPGQVLWDMGKTETLNKLKPYSGTALSVVETQYKYEQEWIRFYEARTR